MTPSFGYNRSKTKYFYYKCTSLSHGNGTRSNCPIRQISLAKFEATVLKLLATLSSRSEFKTWQLKIQDHNTEAMITALKEKKDSFLEALVTNPFLSGERKLINGRIEELEAEIKRHNSQLFKLQFEHSQLSENLIDMASINEMILQFQHDFAHPTIPQHHAFLAKSIIRINLYPKTIEIFFSKVPFELPFLRE